MGDLLRPASPTSGAQRCVQVCSMDQSEGREEKPHHPPDKDDWKRPQIFPHGGEEKVCSRKLESVVATYIFWNCTDLLKVLYVVQKGCGNF